MTAEPTTLRDLLQKSAQLYRDHPALAMVDGPSISYAALWERVQQLSRLLHDHGVVGGDRVALLGENMPNWGTAYFAIITAGAIVVPILGEFPSADIHHIIRHAECKSAFVSQRLYEKVEEMERGGLHTVIRLDDFSIVPPRTKKEKLNRIIDQGTRELSRLKDAALRVSGRIPNTARPDDVAVIVYTSGTTGHSKGVMLTHNNLISDARGVTTLVTVGPEDRLLSILPLAHTYEGTLGLITPLMLGASVYYLDRLPSAPVLLPALQKVKPTILLMVPLIIEKIYKGRIQPALTRSIVLRGLSLVPPIRKALHRAAGKKLLSVFGGKVRILAVGGAALAPEVEKFLREARFPYTIGYGLTETSPLVAGTSPEKTKYRSTGPALPGTQIKIQDPDPDTGEGEIMIKGPTVMKGYYKDPERTAAVLTGDGWFKTGDLGIIDDDRYLYIKGRLKNMILGPSGKNIYPEEIEAVIDEFELILESLVFEENDRLVARIHLDYEKLDERFPARTYSESEIRRRIQQLISELRTQINDRLPSYSRISSIIEQREPFEKTPTQKIKRHLYASQQHRVS